MTTETTEHKLANGKLTIQNNETGEHRTFKVRTQPDDAPFAPGQRVIALLTGSDNEVDYTGFGFVKDDGSVHVFKRKCAPSMKKPTSWQWFALMLQVLVSERLADGTRGIKRDAYTVLQERTCIKCNRTLTDPESIRLGIGPVCRGDA